MTTLEIHRAIREQGLRAWAYANASGNHVVLVELINGPPAGIQIVGATGMLYTQLHDCAAEIKTILMSELDSTFPYPKVRITVDAPYTAPAATVPPTPPPTQDPPNTPPPIIDPPLPPTTPPTPNDKIYYV